jgi:hypothetical protein
VVEGTVDSGSNNRGDSERVDNILPTSNKTIVNGDSEYKVIIELSGTR